MLASVCSCCTIYFSFNNSAGQANIADLQLKFLAMDPLHISQALAVLL